VSGLAGTGRVADDLYLMAHHDVSGKPLLSPRAAGLGLAGGLVAELVLAGAVQVSAGGLAVTGRPPSGDPVTLDVLSALDREPEWPSVRDWLAYLGRTAAEDVAGRLARSGYLVAARGWRGQRWIPADPDCALAPVARVRSVLDPYRQRWGPPVVLAGLAEACGLGQRMAQYLPDEHYRRLHPVVGQLTPDLLALISQVRAAVDSALLCHRM
jgi:hypothetical protein